MIKKEIKTFLKYKKLKLTNMTVLSALIQISTIIIPILSAKLIDILLNKNIEQSIIILIYISILLIASLILQYFFKMIKTSIKQKMSFIIQKFSLGYVIKSYIPFKYDNSQTKLGQNILVDSDIISNFIVDGITDLFNNVLIFSISLLVLLKLNILFFLISLISIFCYILLTFTMQPKVSKSMYKSKEFESKYYTTYINMFQSIINIRNFSNYNKVFSISYNDFNRKFIYYIKTYKLIYFFYSIGNIFTSVIQIIYYILGIILITQNKITIGQFTIVISFYNFLLSSINYFLSFFETYNNFLASWKRINKNIYNYNNNSEKYIKEKIDKINKIEIRDFKLNLNNKILSFDKVNINSGDKIILKGKNGVGKSTLINIITGVYKPPLNKILLNDKFVEYIDMENLRKDEISICIPDTKFILDKVIDNINYYLDQENYNKNDIKNLILNKKLSNMFSNIDKFLISDIKNLSTGQKQKISILIAILKKSSVLILDEPTIGLDDISKQCLKDFINKEKNKIIIIISHENTFNDLINKKYLITKE